MTIVSSTHSGVRQSSGLVLDHFFGNVCFASFKMFSFYAVWLNFLFIIPGFLQCQDIIMFLYSIQYLFDHSRLKKLWCLTHVPLHFSPPVCFFHSAVQNIKLAHLYYQSQHTLEIKPNMRHLRSFRSWCLTTLSSPTGERQKKRRKSNAH